MSMTIVEESAEALEDYSRVSIAFRVESRLRLETILNGMGGLTLINVPACRFYAKQGCVLGAIDRYAYPDHPDEVQLLWYKEIK